MTHDNETELLPCPLCRGSVKHRTDSALYYGDRGYRQKSEDFVCQKCGLKLSVYGDEITKEQAFAQWNTRATPPPSGDAVRLALERAIWLAENFANWDNGVKDHSGSMDEGDVLAGREIQQWKEALHALPATPANANINGYELAMICAQYGVMGDDAYSLVKELNEARLLTVNPPSAERAEALEALEFLTDGEVYTTNGLKAYNVVRAALSAPVDTGWIDEMKLEPMADENYLEGWNDAIDAVKQKLDGRG